MQIRPGLFRGFPIFFVGMDCYLPTLLMGSFLQKRFLFILYQKIKNEWSSGPFCWNIMWNKGTLIKFLKTERASLVASTSPPVPCGISRLDSNPDPRIFEWRPPLGLPPAFVTCGAGNRSIKFTNVIAAYSKKTGVWYCDSARVKRAHITREGWAELIRATSLEALALLRSPIKLSSQRQLVGSRTRQEARCLPFLSPPQVAMTGLGPDVKNVAGEDLGSGRGGREQPFEFG